MMLGVNIDTYFYPKQIFLQNNNISPLNLCSITENLCASVEPVNKCNQDSNYSTSSITPIYHTSPNAHLSHSSTASSSGPRKSVRLDERVESFFFLNALGFFFI